MTLKDLGYNNILEQFRNDSKAEGKIYGTQQIQSSIFKKKKIVTSF
jgi:hypothetical protein